MTSTDDLDDFFKKKDRKGQKHKKQTGLLTNNEALIKKLEIITSETLAYKENFDLDAEDEEFGSNATAHQIILGSASDVIEPPTGNYLVEKKHSHWSTANQKSKSNSKVPVKENNQASNSTNQQQQDQDEWDDGEEARAKYEELCLKLTGNRKNHDHFDDDDDDDDDKLDDEHDHNNPENDEQDSNAVDGDQDRKQRANRRREPPKDKTVWKLDQVKATVNELIEPEKEKEKPVEEVPPVVQEKPASSGVYLPPHARVNTGAVTVIGGNPQRKTKKENLNIASNEEFPTLGAAPSKR